MYSLILGVIDLAFNKLHHIGNWIYNVAFVNILWIIFTILGLGVFGVFPATAAMFAIARKWLILGERDFNILQTFWEYYRKDFFKLNGFALFFFVIGYCLYFNAAFLVLNPGSFQFLIPGTIIIIIAYVMTLLFFFPVFVHYNMKFFQYIKQAFMIAVYSPFELISTILTIGLIVAFMAWIPGIIPLFTGSVLAVCMTLLVNRTYKRISIKAEIYAR